MTTSTFDQQVLMAADTPLAAHSVPTVDEFVGAEFDRYQLELASMMQHANRTIEFDPVVHIQSGSCVGSEALTRFPGQTSPARWFEIAHALGNGVELEMLALDTAIQLRATAPSGFVSVNASAELLADPRCRERLESTGDDHLVVELTEQTTLPELGRLRMVVDGVRSEGARLAVHVDTVDAAALRTIARLEPDMVKLNAPLTARLGSDSDDSNAAQARNFFARCRYDGIFVVAVGVETPDQLRRLEGHCVDAHQGVLAREMHHTERITIAA